MGKKRDIDSLKPKVSIKQSNMDGIFSRYTLKKQILNSGIFEAEK